MRKRFRNTSIPMNLQLFAEGGQEGNDGIGDSGTQQQTGQQGSQPGMQIDYNRIQQMLNGTLAAKEETALKSYFKQQGLSQEEAEQAMATFRAEKAKNQPDVGAMQTQLTQAQAAMQEAQLQSAATMVAVTLGIGAKSIPYVLKMADLTKVVGQDGKISEEEVKNALNKVLEDVPALKPQTQQTSGFKFGASGQGHQQTATEDALKQAFGL